MVAIGAWSEAKAVVVGTLKRFPGLTIQAIVSTPDWSELDRQRLIETMRKGGFPACAVPETVAKVTKLASLPECAQPRAAN